MKTALDQLAQYAAYHRDRRNIRTHLVGIPMIVVGIAILLACPFAQIGAVPVSATLLAATAASIYYLRLDRPLGVTMALIMAGAACIGAQVAMQPTAVWLAAGASLFVVGWVLQFIGHYYEGKKPAFVDDLVGLIIGPLFVVCEVAFALGLLGTLKEGIEARVGPTH